MPSEEGTGGLCDRQGGLPPADPFVPGRFPTVRLIQNSEHATLPLTGSVMPGKALSLSEPRFPPEGPATRG